MPVPVAFGKKTEWKDGKQVETAEDNVINDVEPLWTKTPSTLKDEDYKKFYHELYPMQDDPLFWIHLNVDYPFNLTGILYFPRIKSNIDLQRNKIQLYCNQVFVTDQVEGIVPDFLTLLHGVIDSPDIPLNVSRSYLQSDGDVKKISTYITKKVSDRLNSIFKDNRQEYESKWDDLKLFINYGMLSQEDFYDRAKDFALFKDVDGKHFTLDEYKTLIKDNQTDKDGQLIYLYATNKDDQYSYIEAAKDKGYSVLLFDGQLDVPTVSMFEQKFEKSRFMRVDSDIIDRIIVKEDTKKSELDSDQTDNLSSAFRSQENIKKIVKEQKKHLIIAIDEVQLLKPEVLTDLKILFNFEMDSINMATVILIGLPVINHILSRSTNEDLNQRIVMNYDFKGLSKEDIRGYVSDRLNLVKVDENIFSDNVFEILPNLVNGSIRKLNLIIERVLTLGAIEKVERIDSELIMKAVNDISLV